MTKSRRFEPKADYFYTVDEIVHFMLDDMMLDTRANEAISVFLRDESEAEAVASVARALSNCVEKLGDLSDSAYLHHGCWEQVISDAERALERMQVEA